ncbi:MAG: hypothetical protein HWN67_22410 [Candidatus Helarchaeota archaeon]|nr:hypothetical protein [Candidatus Helarchaeota archaeon]
MKNTKKFLLTILMVFITFPTLISIFNLHSFIMPNNLNGFEGINPDFDNYNIYSKNRQETKQWIKDPSFNYTISQNWSHSETGDLTDLELAEGPGFINYNVIGNQTTEEFARNFSESGWTMMRNPDFPLFPNETGPNLSPENIFTIDSDGIIANHTWDERGLPFPSDAVGQTPSILWKKNESSNINISDFEVISASIDSVVNFSARDDIEAPGESVPGEAYTYDHVRTFIKISDINELRSYEIAYYKYQNDTFLSDIFMDSIPEQNLVYFLNKIFELGNDFRIILGINFFCEDNENVDHDAWYYVRIKSFNLTFTYQKIIDQNTKGIWSQISDNFTANGEKFIVNEAKLNFKYKLDQIWPTTSPNSRIIIKINDNVHPEILKLSNTPLVWQEAKAEGFDVTHLLVKYENVTLAMEFVIADTFNLSTNRTLSIDDVTLNATITILEASGNGKAPFYLFPTGQDWSWLIILLSIIITAILATHGIYTFRTKRPPMIRKIRKLRGRIKKNNFKIPVQVEKRDKLVDRVLSYKLKKMGLAYTHKPLKPKVEKKLVEKKPKKGSKLKLLLLFAFFAFLLFMIFSSTISNITSNPSALLNSGIFKRVVNSNYDLQSKDKREYKQWLNNPDFDPPINQSWSNSSGGEDLTDIDLTEDLGHVNYVIIGDNRSTNYNNTPPKASDWVMERDPDYAAFPNDTNDNPEENSLCLIDNDGVFYNHSWREISADEVGQISGALWKQNKTLPVNMRDYEITSASVSAIVNGSPGTGIYAHEEAGEGAFQGAGDHARFFIKISDPSGDLTYTVADYKYSDNDNDLNDTYMFNVTESDLIFYLTSALLTDDYTFTIIMGINVLCEDNEVWDNDTWNYLRINSVNLSFTYRKKITQNTYGRWNQIGDLFNGGDFIINEAKFYFQYKIDKNITLLSPNSEIRIIINSSTHSETVSLSTANSIFQDAKLIGFDVTNLIIKNDNIRVSLEVYLADNFPLEENITISIDNVSLYISRTIFIPPDYSPLLLFWPIERTNWMIFFMILMIIVLSLLLGAYQTYYRYPPTVRTLRKLRKNVKKNNLAKPVPVNTREKIIQKHLKTKLKGIPLKKVVEIDKAKLITNDMINKIAANLISQLPKEKLTDIDATKLSSEEMKNIITNSLLSMYPKRKRLEIDTAQLLTVDVLNKIASSVKSQIPREEPPEIVKPVIEEPVEKEEVEPITEEMINNIAADLISQVPRKKLLDIDATKLSSKSIKKIITNSLLSMYPKRKRLEIDTAQLLTVDVLNKIASSVKSQIPREEPAEIVKPVIEEPVEKEEVEPITEEMINNIAADLISQVPREKLLDIDATKLSFKEMNNIIAKSLKSLYPKRKRLEIDTAQLLTVDVLNKIASATKSQLKEKPVEIEEAELVTEEIINQIASDLMSKIPQQKLFHIETSDLKTKKINKRIVKNLKSMLPRKRLAKIDISDLLTEEFYNKVVNAIKSEIPSEQLLDSFISDLLTKEVINKIASNLKSEVPKLSKEELSSEVTKDKIVKIIESLLPREKILELDTSSLLTKQMINDITNAIKAKLPKEKLLELDTSELLSEEVFNKVVNLIKSQLPKEKLLELDTSELLTEEMKNVISNAIKTQQDRLLEIDPTEVLNEEMITGIANAVINQLPIEKLLELDTSELLTQETINNIDNAIKNELIKVKPPVPELSSYILTKVQVKLKRKKRPLVDILRFVEPNIQFNEKLISFYFKFRVFVPEIHIKEIIPENLKIKKTIPFPVPRVQKTEEGKNIQIWKIVPELARDTFEFGYICSGKGIEKEFPFEIEIHGMEISSAKEKQKELKKAEVFTPNFHELIQKYKEKENKEE